MCMEKEREECIDTLQSCSIQNSKEPVINRLVSQQSTEGFWKNVSLIGELFDKKIEQAIKGEKEMVAVITYLIAKWI